MNRGFCLLLGLLGLGASFGDALPGAIGFNDDALFALRPAYPLDDTGGTNGANACYWYFAGAAGDNGALIDRYGSSEVKYEGFDPLRNPQPDYMKSGSENVGRLAVAGEAMLARTFAPVSSASGPLPDESVQIPAGDLFIDALVTFRPTETSETAADLALSGDKLAVRLLVTENGAKTNLVVSAASFGDDGVFSYADYPVTNAVKPDVWYRLTARVAANAATRAGSSYPAFALYLDGRPVGCELAAYESAIGSAGEYYFGGSDLFAAGRLFPSMQQTGGKTYADRMYALGMTGRGYVDEIAVTEDDPFAQASAEIDFRVLCDNESVSKLEVIVAREGSDPVTNRFETAPLSGSTVRVEPGATVTVVPTLTEHRVLGEALHLAGNLGAVAAHTGFVVTMADPESGKFADGAALTATVPTTRVHFRAGGKDYTTFAEAVAAAAGTAEKLVQLCDDVTLSNDPRADNGQARVKPNQTVVLDLMGNTMKGDHFVDEAAVYVQGSLTVYDSVGGGVIEAPGAVIETVISNDAVEVNHAVARLTLGSETETQIFTVKGIVRNSTAKTNNIVVCGGQYLNTNGLASADFYLAKYLKDDRFTAESVTIDGLPGYRVTNLGNAHLVRFETSLEGSWAEPKNKKVEDGACVSADDVAVKGAVGYTNACWRLSGAAEPYDFTKPVTSNFTLVAELVAQRYKISYDAEMSGAKDSYTVAELQTALSVPERTHFAFTGWRDSATGLVVDRVGRGATFVGTETPVTGDLELVAEWTAVPIVWENVSAVYGNIESNGTYGGSWDFTLTPKSTYLDAGTRVILDEIAFCVVNPTTYPKTAPCLRVVTNEATAAVVSRPRAWEIAGDGETYVATNVLKNGRARLGYRFEGLTVEVGSKCAVSFCDEKGTLTNGFLRLKYCPKKDDPIFGNCSDVAPVPSPVSDYGAFCPAYEIRGRLEGGEAGK